MKKGWQAKPVSVIPPADLNPHGEKSFGDAVEESQGGIRYIYGRYHTARNTWGCGAGCVMGGIVDVATGKAQMLPFTVSAWPPEVTEPLVFRPDSDLLIARGKLNEQGGDLHYLRWQDGQFVPVVPDR